MSSSQEKVTEALQDPVQKDSQKELNLFFVIVGILFVIRFGLGFLRVPVQVAFFANFALTAVIMGLSIYSLYRGAAHQWRASLGWIFLISGVIMHAGSALLIRQLAEQAVLANLISAIGQSGVLVWCLGLGGLLSILIKEKNMLLPVAIFLAGFDVLIILTPETIQSKIAEANPEVVGQIGMKLPEVATTAQPLNVPTQDIAYVGPADLFFAATFFCLLFRYSMKPQKTLQVLIPVLFGYLLLVGFTGIPLPALVPIGIVILAVNWSEFRMSKQEKQMTWVVTVIAICMAGYGLFKRLTYKPVPVSPAESSQTVGGPLPPGYEENSEQPAGD